MVLKIPLFIGIHSVNWYIGTNVSVELAALIQISTRNINQPENYSSRSLDCSDDDIANSSEMLQIHET